MNDKKHSFEFTYSADRNNEIEKIRNKYISVPKENTTLEELRKLDKSTTRPGMIISVIMGIVGTLTMGGGMSIVMEMDNHFMLLGILTGIIGIIIALLAFPVYKAITNLQRKKNAPRIIELSNQLLDESESK